MSNPNSTAVAGTTPAAARLPTGLGVTIGLLFTIPFLVYYRPLPIGDFHTEWLASVFFVVLICAALPTLRHSFRVSGWLLAFPATLAVVVLIHLFLGRYLYFFDWGLWLGYLAVFTVAMVVGQGLQSGGWNAEVTSRLAWAIVLTSSVQIITQLAQIFRLEEQLAPFVVRLMDRSVCRIHGNIGQANQATAMAWLGVAAVLYLLHIRRIPRVLAALLVGCLLVSSALTASRMSWLFALVVGAALLSFDRGQRYPIRRRLVLAAGLLIAFFVADTIGARLVQSVNADCVSSLARLAGESGTASIRWELWRQAVLVWTEFPWFGSGAGGYMGWVYRLESPGESQPIDGYAHNSLLQLLAEFGVVGFGAAVGFVGVAALQSYRARNEVDAHRMLLMTWVAILLVYSMLEFPLWYMHFLIFFGLCFGLMLNPAWSYVSVRVHGLPVLGIAAIAILTGAAFVAYEYKKAERAYFLVSDAIAMKAIGSDQLNQALDQILREARLYRLHVEYAQNVRVPITRDDLAGKLDDNARLLQRIPLATPVVQEILLRTLAGEISVAREHLRKLLQFDPPGVDEALADLRRFVKEKPDDFAVLGPLIDEEVKRAPKRRW